MMQSKPFSKGKPISGPARQIILNVLNNLALSQPNKGSACLQTAQLTGVSQRTVQRILKASKNGEPDLPENCGRKRRRGKPITDIDTLDCGAIRRTVHNLYNSGKMPTLLMILEELKNGSVFDGRRSSLHRVLSKIGFKWRVMDGKKQLTEKAHIVAWRRQYLRKLHENDHADSPVEVVYVGESYLWTSNTKKQGKDASSSTVGIKAKVSKDLKIVHAGSKKGFVPNASLIFESKSSFGDYQKDMSEENFQKWFALKLLPQLKEPTIIVMDNAAYHTVEIDKPPSGNQKKSEIQNWLTSHGISYDAKEIKAELLLRIKQGVNEKRFVVEHLAQEMGHQVIFLPPNHRELNPMELIWVNIRKDVASNSTQSGVVDMWNEALINVTETDWKNAIKNVKKIANEYWEADLILDDCVPMDLDGSSDSDEPTRCDNSDGSDIESI